MIWIVVDDDPWPDKYIPILVRPQLEAVELKRGSARFRVFDNEPDAILHAEELKNKYQAKTVRMFYSDGFSKTITS